MANDTSVKTTSKARLLFKPSRRLFVTVLGVVLCSVSLWYFLHRYLVTHLPYTPKPRTVVTANVTHPSESPVATSSTYTVAPDQPRQIILPSIHKQAFVQQVGVLTTGAMAVPDNISLAGWYVKSVRPGDPGLSIIDGHVYGYYSPGVFVNLNRLKAGDTFRVQFGDMSTRAFKVISLHAYSPSDATKALFERDNSITAQLNLITCTSYSAAKHGYTQRLIVVAERT